MQNLRCYLCAVQATLVHSNDDHAAGIYALTAHKGVLYSGSADKHVAGWNPETGQPTGFAVRLQQAVYGLGVLPNQNKLLIGNAHGGFHVVDLKEKKEERLLQVHRKGVFDFCMLPGGRFAACGGDGTMSVWDEYSIELIRQIPLSDKKLRRAIVSINRPISVCDGAGPVHLLDPETLSPMGTLKGHNQGSNCAAFHPTKNLLITGGRDAHLRAWNLETEKEELALPAHNFSIYALAFSPDGRFLATASFDKTVKIWDAQTFDLLLRLERPHTQGHRASVNALLWRDASTLITAGDDKHILIWNLQP